MSRYIVIQESMLGAIIGNQVQVLRADVRVHGSYPEHLIRLPTDKSKYRLATLKDFDKFRVSSNELIETPDGLFHRDLAWNF